MSNPFPKILFDAVKIGLAAWSAVWVEPCVSVLFPNLGNALQFLIATLFTAFVLELLLQLLFGWPRVEITWEDKDDGIPLPELQARVRKKTSNTQVFKFKISTYGGGWLGYLCLRGAMKAKVKFRVGVDRTSIFPTVEDSYKEEGNPTASSVDSCRGFEINLGDAPSKPGPWHWADVRWRDESTPRGDRFNINYRFVHEKKIVEILFNIIVHKKVRAKHFMIVGS